MKRACYLTISRPFEIVLAPAWWFYRKMLYDTNVFAEHCGIVIAEFGPKEGTDPLFVERTKEALDYLEKLDSRRFRRVKREIKAIVKAHPSAWYGGKYLRHVKACLVNPDGFKYEENSTDAMKLFACTLVHEATHGMLDSLDIPYNRKTKLRIERLCIEEEVRFSSRFNDENEKQWTSYLRSKLIKHD